MSPPVRQRRMTLLPGEVVNQTRRSIDLAIPRNPYASSPTPTLGGSAAARSSEDYSDYFTKKHNSPAFIVLGAQKCGTTSMYEYICQHPLVVKPKRRETHYFDWRCAERESGED